MTTQWHFADADNFAQQTAAANTTANAAASERWLCRLTFVCTSGWFAKFVSRTLTVDQVAC
jgi:hypothetical protein